MIRNPVLIGALAAVALTSAAEARDQIRIVGSSTVFPFSAAVAERFGRTTGFATPVVESTGSGGGLKLFCAGVGESHPDIANASRRIKSSEVDNCAGNGVDGIIEVAIGYDGIVLANAKGQPPIAISRRDLFLALAKEVPVGDGETAPNAFETWREINPELPDARIEVLGPPPTSGTRDAFVELAMEGGCTTFPWIAELKETDGNRYQELCHGIREDGKFIEAGENDNLIVQKLTANPAAFGVFGFSFLDQNADVVQGSLIDEVEPTFENIADGSYPVSRELYFYVKKAHVDTIPGLREYMAEFTSEAAWGPDGYLADKGLIPMPAEERAAWRAKVTSLADLVM